MNERIKELAEQAGAEIYGHKDFATICVNGQDADDLMRKFAELIVRECIQVVDGMADPEEDSDRYVWALHNACEKIKEHFGVL